MAYQEQQPINGIPPVIHVGLTHPYGTIINVPQGASLEQQRIPVDLMRATNPAHAYVIIRSMGFHSLNHHGPGWGDVQFGLKVPRVDPSPAGPYAMLLNFQLLPPENTEFVAIKRLRKSVVNSHLSRGGHENPYNEISCMQQYGNNECVLGCLEVLEDETYLYIISPYCGTSTVVDFPSGTIMERPDEGQVRIRFKHLLRNLRYLRHHGICHRDLSANNCLLYRGNWVFNDLAMSFLVPTTENPERSSIPAGRFGKFAYLPPEVFFCREFDPYACDLWSVAVILFTMLTGERLLYEVPTYKNIKYLYFVRHRGFHNIKMGLPYMDDNWALFPVQARNSLLRMIQICSRLSPDVLDLLDGCFRHKPADRWTLEDIDSCSWMN